MSDSLAGRTGPKRKPRCLAAALGDVLKRRGMMLATAESCTGGLVGDTLTNVPGSSEWYLGGVVAYANALKSGLLGVTRETLRRSGAVSAQTAGEMARGVCDRLGADVGLAVSGIAGPGRGSPRKPVGLVYLAVCLAGKLRTKKCSFEGSRRAIKQAAAAEALSFCLGLARGGS